MIKTTTPNEVILNVYQESSKAAQEDFRIECLLNTMLAQECEDLEEIKVVISSLGYQPKKSSIENILNYSNSFLAIQ